MIFTALTYLFTFLLGAITPSVFKDDPRPSRKRPVWCTEEVDLALQRCRIGTMTDFDERVLRKAARFEREGRV
jgi:hypothetical protein